MSVMTRHRFDPARFLLGLSLLVIACGLAARALGRWDVSYVPLVLAVPAALVLSGTVSAADRLLRGRPREVEDGHSDKVNDRADREASAVREPRGERGA